MHRMTSLLWASLLLLEVASSRPGLLEMTTPSNAAENVGSLQIRKVYYQELNPLESPTTLSVVLQMKAFKKTCESGYRYFMNSCRKIHG